VRLLGLLDSAGLAQEHGVTIHTHTHKKSIRLNLSIYSNFATIPSWIDLKKPPVSKCSEPTVSQFASKGTTTPMAEMPLTRFWAPLPRKSISNKWYQPL
jgi:hypothetical protein